MNAEFFRCFLLWCLIINYGVLINWFVAFRFVHDWMFNLHSRWFHISEERFDGFHYVSMAIYKVGILLFNLVPYVALCILRSHAS